MARITPAQAQGISQSLSGITSSLQAMQRNLGSMTPAQKTQLSGALGSLGGALGTARQVIGGGGSAPAAPSASPITTTVVKTPDQEYQDKMKALYTNYQNVLSEKPIEKGLSPEEKQTFADEKTQLKARYETGIEALKRQQEKDKSRLLGRYAYMGFSEPGAIAGPIASEPGIVTKALQDIGEQQKRELTNREQAQAGDLLAATKAEQEAARRAKTEEADAFEKRQAALMRNLEKQIELAKPETFTMTEDGRVFQRDRVTGQIKDVTPGGLTQKFAGHAEAERNGRKVRIFYDKSGREVGTSDLGPVTEDKPTSFKEWMFAGGEKGTGMSYMQWVKFLKEKSTEDLFTPPNRK